jgi:queuine tRNA-ribosyltransferase
LSSQRRKVASKFPPTTYQEVKEFAIEAHFTPVKICTDTRARLGKLVTSHGVVPTPAFLPVASQGAVKTLTPEELKDIGVTIVLSNTYHLYLQPGIDVIEKFGGLHRFMDWGGPILTDSGGYQVFSLARLCKVTDDGVTFRSHIDGSEHHLTPESVIEFQQKLGADIIMTLDECSAPDAGMDRVREAVDRTSRWAERCRKHHRNSDQLLFGIVQGGTSLQLRQRSAKAITSLDFPGYAIGGLCLGEAKDLTWSMADETIPFLPAGRSRYLMGVGSPEDIVEGVSRGIDIFDSALPTRVARNGALFTLQGRQNIRKSVHKTKKGPVDADCDCYTCRNFSVAYLHHLFKCEELLAYRLATIHNLRFITRLMYQIHTAIQQGTFTAFKSNFLSQYQVTDEEVRLAQKRKWLSTPRHSDNAIRG